MTERISKYEILGKIGQGAMGEVWKAHDPVLNRFVAIKTISAGGNTDETLRKRFQREAQSAAHLNHPNIITVFDYGEEQGKLYMAMELLEGSDLKEVIVGRTLNEIHDKVDVMEQICDGLAYAHTKDVVHRDLKPGNIHIQPSGQVKIMDFGLARLGSSDMTREGMILGTPNYMSPEQVRGEKADARSDIFSLGAVFYELLSNRKPFDADSLHAVLFNVLQQEPEPVRNWVPDLPGELVGLVEKALSKDPVERYQNASEMREALRIVRRQLAEGWVGEATVSDSLMPDEPLPASAPAARARTGSSGTMRSPFRSDGTAALDPAQAAKVQSLSRSKTIVPVQASTAAVAPSPPAPAARPRWPLYAGAIAVVAAVAGFVVFRPAPKAPEAASATNQQAEMARLVAGTRLELARRDLQDKDFKAAIAHGDEVLKIDPTNADARKLVDDARRSLAELDSAAEEARAAFERGDADGASRALTRAMTLDPKHPVVAELLQKLNTRFRGEAEDARKAASRARGAAEKAGATGLASFGEAVGLAGEGESLVRAGGFAVATQKFMAARDGFERARRDAETRAAAHTPAPTLPATTLAAATPPPATLAPLPPTLPPTTQAAAPPPPVTAPPVTAPVSEEPAIRRLVADYGRAIESKDLGLFRTLKPNLSADEEKRLREAFRGIQSQKVEIEVQSIQISGSQATVRVGRKDVINGSPVSPFQQKIVLARGATGWTIVEIGR